MNHLPSLKKHSLLFFKPAWMIVYYIKKGFQVKLQNYLSFQCSGPSMEPTIENSAVVFAENLSRHFYSIQR